MAHWDRNNLIRQCNVLAARPDIDTDMDPGKWDILLTQGQDHWYGVIAEQAPNVLWGEPVKIDTQDGGYTYRIPGTIMGIPDVREGRYGRPLMVDEYILDNGVIRFPYGRSRTFAGGVWVRYARHPHQINAVTEPQLKPEYARILIVYRALAQWASRPGSAADPNTYLAMEDSAWYGNPDTGELGILARLKLSQAQMHNGELQEMGGGRWWISPDFGPQAR